MQQVRVSIPADAASIRPRHVLTSWCVAALTALALAIAILPPTPARADAYEGIRAYQQGRKDEAIRLLRPAAWQDNNVFAQLLLGDIYSAKSESDKGYYDPIEAVVWYYLARLNVTVAENTYHQPVSDKLRNRIGEAETSLRNLYSNLLQDERVDVRYRVTYIQACRGPDGLIFLGQLHDRRFDRTVSFQAGGPGGQPQPSVDYIQKPLAPGGGEPIYGSSGPVYGGGQPQQFLGGLYDPKPIAESELEARLFYKLAELAGHPFAKDYLEGLNGSLTLTDAQSKQADIQARAKADRWLAPFEFYAAETRYRGELPSGLVLSDECPVNAEREKALAVAKHLIPPSVLYEFLDFLGFARGVGRGDLKRAVAKFQDFMGEPQTGDLTPTQLVRLVQIAAVRGHKKAQRCLGIMYVKGVGVIKNLVRGEKWLIAAGEQGDGEALYALSELYSLGGPGIEKSEDKANRYRQGSAAAGFEPVRSEFLRLFEAGAPPAQRPRAPRRNRPALDEQDGDE